MPNPEEANTANELDDLDDTDVPGSHKETFDDLRIDTTLEALRAAALIKAADDRLIPWHTVQDYPDKIVIGIPGDDRADKKLILNVSPDGQITAINDATKRQVLDILNGKKRGYAHQLARIQITEGEARHIAFATLCAVQGYK